MRAVLRVQSLLRNGFIAAACVLASYAHASVVVVGTRVIYNQDDPEVTVKLTNQGGSPGLVQVWIDKGDPKAEPSSIKVPFIVTPPVSRIDPGKGQTLRIVHMGAPEIKDRESVYWLNVLEIPPVAKEQDANRLQFAFRTRIKLFYRPADLPGSPEQAPAGITWHMTQSNGSSSLRAYNPSAYNVSFSRLDVSDGRETASFTDGGMLAPGETRQFPLTGARAISGSATVRYEFINDYGGLAKGDASLK
ncbi:fimbria/pilus periplasmic chaperone [Paraburkholderia heleia]|uniref:fimbria/pilus periplasmic chaperone n=1 Tax=Paraburkholderia heleia TaxID=634127 RepID=UPI0005A8D1B1|nr:fimbria/pilus periplasmic chaperone [Paraburkholderia heleia]